MPQDNEDGQKVNQMIQADRRRWPFADQNKDGNLDIREFEAFLYPEENPIMAEIVALETLETVDKDGDGCVSPAARPLTDHIVIISAVITYSDVILAKRLTILPIFRHDRAVDLNEYLEDIFPEFSGNQLPEYAREEIELFRNRRDANGDGKLDLQDVLHEFSAVNQLIEVSPLSRVHPFTGMMNG